MLNDDVWVPAPNLLDELNEFNVLRPPEDIFTILGKAWREISANHKRIEILEAELGQIYRLTMGKIPTDSCIHPFNHTISGYPRMSPNDKRAMEEEAL